MLFSAWPCWSYMVKRWYKRYHSPPFPAAIGEKRPHGQSRFPTIPGQKAKTLGHLGPFHTNVSFQITDPQGSFSIRMKVPVKNHLSERRPSIGYASSFGSYGFFPSREEPSSITCPLQIHRVSPSSLDKYKLLSSRSIYKKHGANGCTGRWHSDLREKSEFLPPCYSTFYKTRHR